MSEAKIRARKYYQDNDIPAFQAESETIAGLRKSLAEKNAYLEALTVTAPIDGMVVSRRLDSLIGSWLRVGEEVMIIDPGKERELLLSISQNDIEAVRNRESNDVVCLLRGREEEISGKLNVLESRATRAVPHDVLVATNGGPLNVSGAPEQESERQQGIARGDGSELSHFAGLDNEQPPAELVKPRFAARVILSALDSEGILEGEWGYVALRDLPRERLGMWIYYKTSEYVRDLIQQAKDMSKGQA